MVCTGTGTSTGTVVRIRLLRCIYTAAYGRMRDFEYPDLPDSADGMLPAPISALNIGSLASDPILAG